MKKSIAVLIAFLMLLLASCTPSESAAERVAGKAMPSILEIRVEFQASGSNASGIILDREGYVVTNAHVVATTIGRRSYVANSVKGKFYDKLDTYDMEIVAYDLDKDLAILRLVGASDFTPIRTSTDGLSYGQRVYAIGNGEGYGLGITEGIISAPKRTLNNELNGYIAEYVQTDAAVSSGMSGGALLDCRGYAVGLMTFKVRDQYATVEGMNFAIPTWRFMEYYKEVREQAA